MDWSRIPVAGLSELDDEISASVEKMLTANEGMMEQPAAMHVACVMLACHIAAHQGEFSGLMGESKEKMLKRMQFFFEKKFLPAATTFRKHAIRALRQVRAEDEGN